MSTLLMGACGDEDKVPASPDAGLGPSATLDDFLPALPTPTGGAQSVFAGEITPGREAELIAGPGAQGLVGDFYLRNRHSRYLIQAPTRSAGVIGEGGNLIDAVRVGPGGDDLGADYFGELALNYVLGRTCDHRSVEVMQDGSGGGAAVIRARGVAAANVAVNARGLGLFPVSANVNPDVDDGIECATTYVLQPDATMLEISWTLFNPEDRRRSGPLAAFTDIASQAEVWLPGHGFDQVDASRIVTSNEDIPPVPYKVLQAPGMAYGLIPLHADPSTPNFVTTLDSAGLLVFGGDQLGALLDPDRFFLSIPPASGITHGIAVALGRDAADVDAQVQRLRGIELVDVSGTAVWAGGSGVPSARIGVYRDLDRNGAVDQGDPIFVYIDPEADGSFTRSLPPGDYVLRAEVLDEARSEPLALSLTAQGASDLRLVLPDPVRFDYEIIDADTGNFIPGKLTVIGRHPSAPDRRLFPVSDRLSGVVRMLYVLAGTTTDVGDGADEPLHVPAGETYRVFASRGTEWSVADQVIAPARGDMPGSLQFRLRRVAAADGYVSSEYHVHQEGSWDSTVASALRVATMVADGVELFATTDHERVSDIQPVIEALGMSAHTRAITGLEVTTPAYGHFNTWPLTRDPADPSGGAIDWAQGLMGYHMIPSEIFAAMRARGAEMVQVNHPRAYFDSRSDNTNFFDRGGLQIDYDQRQILGDIASAPVPNAWLRLPETSLWDDSFNALEVWNGPTGHLADTNGDGIREITAYDIVTRYYFAFLSLGLTVTPTASSDTHTVMREPSGFPRTYVRVTNDDPGAVDSGAVVADAMQTLTGAAARDVVLTNGPHIEVRAAAGGPSAIGAVLTPVQGEVVLHVQVVAPAWAEFDTVEIFANATPDVTAEETALTPLLCLTTREPGTLAESDVCALAPGGVQPLEVITEDTGEGILRYRASLQVPLRAADIVKHPSASGDDAWVIVRARGTRAIYPLVTVNILDDENIDTFISGSEAEQSAILRERGLPAAAMTAPIFIDFDGGGYRAPLSPQ